MAVVPSEEMLDGPYTQNHRAEQPRLYPKLLGAAWGRLHPAVRHVHTGAGPARATGTFQIKRAPGRLLGLVLDLAGIPPASDAAPVQLAIAARVTPHGPIERWHRVFGGRRLVTGQAEAPSGLLAEQIGGLEFHFRLVVEDGALLFEQQRCLVCLGHFRLPLPSLLAPFVWCREQAAAVDTLGQTEVCVTVSTPGGRLLFSYRGTVYWMKPGHAAGRMS
ncbi:MAG: DUF4166 domain-containing protein [Chloroflexota bacterium]